MKIVVDVNDQVAVNFLTKLGALVQESGIFLLPEGGSKEIYCWSSDKSEMGKKVIFTFRGKNRPSDSYLVWRISKQNYFDNQQGPLSTN